MGQWQRGFWLIVGGVIFLWISSLDAMGEGAWAAGALYAGIGLIVAGMVFVFLDNWRR